MSTQIARAIQLHQEAKLAEEQGNIDRAEILYVESQEIFRQNGGAYLIDTASIMNAIACMKEKYSDVDGALRAAEKAVRILKNYTDSLTNRKADEIRIHAWLIIGNSRRQLSHEDKAEQAFVQALKYASKIFGETDERTVSIHEQLSILNKSKTDLEK